MQGVNLLMQHNRCDLFSPEFMDVLWSAYRLGKTVYCTICQTAVTETLTTAMAMRKSLACLYTGEKASRKM